MKPLRSISWRLQFWYGVMLLAVLAGGGAVAYQSQRLALLRSTDDELERRAGAWARLLDSAHAATRPAPPRGPARRTNPPPRAEENVADTDAGGSWFALRWDSAGNVLSRSASAPDDCPRPETASARLGGPSLRVRGECHEAVYRLASGDLLIVGRNLTSELRALNQVSLQAAGGAFAVWLLALLIGRWLIGRALRPITQISTAAEKIAGGDLSQRVQNREQDSELGQLTAVLNATFARLEAAFARQSQFTADAAHELRTPVSIILTHTQTALTDPGLTEEHRDAFAACHRAAQRMRALLESLLRLARLDSGEALRRHEPVELADRIASVLDSLRPLADLRRIRLSADLQSATCSGDAEWLDQVFTNLVDNAIKHNRDTGQVWVTTRTEPGHAVCQVTDDGPGIAASDLPHVFSRFYRADRSRSRQTGGVGLGLAIARSIVEAHGGTLTVDSLPGQGTVFTVRLPA